ncbi:hypothetical protein QQ008_13505 [Fulvivirgaceae bacterium BMA10]|uniref:Uncharacterized protein n=1 Tax=Splendidivirga corallicola TaxID=3051826 RepID=A0ABT8KQW8_9BACT|nr:hypothetical protein [Fulvivirgaceae bacterium BMA10]
MHVLKPKKIKFDLKTLKFHDSAYGKIFLNFLNCIYSDSPHYPFAIDAPLIEPNRREALNYLIKKLNASEVYYFEMTCKDQDLWENRLIAKRRNIDYEILVRYRQDFVPSNPNENLFKEQKNGQ